MSSTTLALLERSSGNVNYNPKTRRGWCKRDFMMSCITASCSTCIAAQPAAEDMGDAGCDRMSQLSVYGAGFGISRSL
jgi:hypothetical protein